MECQEGKSTPCEYKDCENSFKRMVIKEGHNHIIQDTNVLNSIDNKRDVYFCNAIPKGETKVKPCHLLHYENYFCQVTTDDTDNDTDDDN